VGYFDRKQYPQGEMLHDYYKENHVVGGAWNQEKNIARKW